MDKTGRAKNITKEDGFNKTSNDKISPTLQKNRHARQSHKGNSNTAGLGSVLPVGQKEKELGGTVKASGGGDKSQKPEQTNKRPAVGSKQSQKARFALSEPCKHSMKDLGVTNGERGGSAEICVQDVPQAKKNRKPKQKIKSGQTTTSRTRTQRNKSPRKRLEKTGGAGA